MLTSSTATLLNNDTIVLQYWQCSHSNIVLELELVQELMPVQKSDMRLVGVSSFEHIPYISSHCHGANPRDILLLLHKSGTHLISILATIVV